MMAVHAEHVIPRNIGGTVVTYHVCNKCNTDVFSEIDAELNRQRFIYDAYKEISTEKRPALKFHFMEAFAIDENGTKLPFVPKSDRNEMIPTKIAEGQFIGPLDVDESKDTFISLIRKIGRKYDISPQFIENHLQPYRIFRSNAKDGDIYRERFLTNANVEIVESTRVKQTIMNAKTPHRFIAKACAEFAHLFGIADGIANMGVIKKHALVGGLEGKPLNFFVDETDIEKAREFHIVLFTAKQFMVIFFGRWGAAVDIEWEMDPSLVYVANNVSSRKLVLCKHEGNQLVTTNMVVGIKEHDQYRLRTNI